MKTLFPFLVGFCLASCSDPAGTLDIRSLERPEDLAFACYGDLRITATDEIVRSPQPAHSCVQWVNDEIPSGQEEPVVRPALFGFILQPQSGTIAVMEYTLNNPFAPGGTSIIDADELTPGKNPITVGAHPIAIATDSTGCFLATANQESCDVTIVDVDSAVKADVPPISRRTPILNSNAEAFIGAPADMLALPPKGDEEIGIVCPDAPATPLYVAYPECGTVAMIDSSSGQITGSILFDATGVPSIGGTDITCATRCGEPMDPARYAPSTLHISDDGSQLLIGGANGAFVTIVDLDPAGFPLSISQLALEGQVGVRRMAVSEVIDMGGDTGVESGIAGNFQFVYAVATDGTVRVVEILSVMSECDTQSDPRFLYSDTDVAFRSCIPVGDVLAPPRRANARSPGIKIPDAVALDIAIGSQYPEEAPVPAANNLVGHFAYITASDGAIYVANIDDDNYPDFELTADPWFATTAFTLAHQLRDAGRNREVQPTNQATGSPLCGFPSAERTEWSPRLSAGPTLNAGERLSPTKQHLAAGYSESFVKKKPRRESSKGFRFRFVDHGEHQFPRDTVPRLDGGPPRGNLDNELGGNRRAQSNNRT